MLYINQIMSLLLKKIIGNRDYLTYYYAQQTLNQHINYDFIYNEGRVILNKY